MALPAILAKFVRMGILMTRCAVIVQNSAELLEFFSVSHIDFMTFETINTPVFSGKLKFGIIVAEFGSGYEFFRCMAV